MPGWMRPANLTPGMWREEQLMPSKSQIALALRWKLGFGKDRYGQSDHIRLWIDLIEETTSVLFGKDS